MVPAIRASPHDLKPLLVLQSPVLSCLSALEGWTEDWTEDWKLGRPDDRTETGVGQDCISLGLVLTGPDWS